MFGISRGPQLQQQQQQQQQLGGGSSFFGLLSSQTPQQQTTWPNTSFGGLIGQTPQQQTTTALGQGSLGIPDMSGTNTSLASSFRPEIEIVIGNLSNPDARACHLLNDTFTRLSQMCADRTELTTFTFDQEANPALRQQKQMLCEQFAMSRGDAFVRLLQDAMKRNPDPNRYHAVALSGFSQLVSRAELQQQQIQMMDGVLKDIQAKQQMLRENLENRTMQKLATIRERYQTLQLKLITVLGLLEDFAIANQLAQVDSQFMHKLHSDFSSFHENFRRSGGGSAKLFELRHEMRALAERMRAERGGSANGCGVISGGDRSSGLSAILSKPEVQTVFEVIDQQQEYYDCFTESVRSDTMLVDALHGALSQIQGTPGSPTSLTVSAPRAVLRR